MGVLASGQTPAAAQDLGRIAALEREAGERIDAHRKASKLSPLAYDDKIAAIARGHSQKMARGEVKLGHEGFEARANEISRFVAMAGAAENVSRHRRKADFAEFAVAGWLASPVHRKTVDGDYDLSGVGAALSEGGVAYFTQIFVKLR